MFSKTHLLKQSLFALLLSFIISLAHAGDNILAVNAGVDQTVNAGDAVSLVGQISLKQENDAIHIHKKKHHKKEHKNKHSKKEMHKKKHHKKEHENKRSKKEAHKEKPHKKEHENKRSKKEAHKKKVHKKEHKNKYSKKDDRKNKHKHHKKKHAHHIKAPDSDDVVINWTQTSGSTVVLTGANTLTPSFNIPASAPSTDVFSFLFTVSDDDNKVIASDSVTITVNAPQVPLLNVSGLVRGVDGNAIAGVQVTGATGTLATSDSQGMISFTLDLNAAQTVRLQKEGFTSQSVVLDFNNNSAIFESVMRARNKAITIANPENGFEFTNDDGAKVIIPANSLVYIDNAGLEVPVTGQVILQMTSVNVSDDTQLGAFPGSFSATDMSGNPAEIMTYGTVEYIFTTVDGRRVNLSSTAQPATIEIPVFVEQHPDGSPVSLGQTNQAVWFLNEDTGKWVQESSTGTIVESLNSPSGLAMQANVTHFTWWNYDIKTQVCLSTVNVTGLPSNAEATVVGLASISFRPRYGSVKRRGNGSMTLMMPFGSQVSLSGSATTSTGYYTASLAPFVGCSAGFEVLTLDFSAGPLVPVISRFDTRVTPVFGLVSGLYRVVSNTATLSWGTKGADTAQVTSDQADNFSVVPRAGSVALPITQTTNYTLTAANIIGTRTNTTTATYVATSPPIVDYSSLSYDSTNRLYSVNWSVLGADTIRYGYVQRGLNPLSQGFDLGAGVALPLSGSVSIDVTNELPQDGNEYNLYMIFSNGDGTIVKEFTTSCTLGAFAQCGGEILALNESFKLALNSKFKML